MQNIRLIGVILGTLIFSLAIATEEVSGNSNPNIVIILVDDLGYGDTGCYGSETIKTPAIDGLAIAGMRFTQFYAASSCCSPSRASLLTGRYPDLVGAPGLVGFVGANNTSGYLSKDAVLLPQILKAYDYHSALIGKWHLGLDEGQRPMQRGFDHYHGFLGGMLNSFWLEKINANVPVFPGTQGPATFSKQDFRLNDTQIKPEGHATETFTDWAIEYLETRKDSGKPFYLQISHCAPHIPIQPPNEFVERTKKRLPDASKKEVDYTAMVEHMDSEIGRFMAALEKMKLSESTLVIFISDNGGYLPAGASNGPLRGRKKTMWEGGIRVPMIAVWPDKIKPNTVCEDTVMIMDIAPTLCEAVGVPLQSQMDGRSIMPLLDGTQKSLPERTLVWPYRSTELSASAVYAVRQGQWKMLRNSPYEKYELFNLVTDPGETTPLKGMIKKREELMRALKRHTHLAGSVPWQGPLEEVQKKREILSSVRSNPK